MNPPGVARFAHRRNTYKARKRVPVHGVLDGTTPIKYRRTFLNKILVVMMTGLFSFVSYLVLRERCNEVRRIVRYPDDFELFGNFCETLTRKSRRR